MTRKKSAPSRTETRWDPESPVALGRGNRFGETLGRVARDDRVAALPGTPRRKRLARTSRAV